MLQDLAFHKIADPPDPGPGLSLVHRTISAAGEALFLYVDAAVEPRVFAKEQDAAGARFPVSVMDDPAGFTLMVLDAGGSARRIELPGVDISCPMAALFPDGRVLLAATRSWWRGPEDFDLNGVIYDPADGSTRRLHLGDGISDVVIDTQGRIWVGYFDEGVFGNLGWSHPGPTGLGAAGLVALDDHGEVLWRFNEDQTPFISDCYALNVHGSEAWAYYYTDFEVARVDWRWQTGRAGTGWRLWGRCPCRQRSGRPAVRAVSRTRQPLPSCAAGLSGFCRARAHRGCRARGYPVTACAPGPGPSHAYPA